MRLAVLAATLLCASGTASATPGIVDVRFRNYSTGDGLSQATAMAMAQDGSGFLWVGTQDGLNRFDGYGFKVYKHVRSQPGTLSDNAVTALAADKDGSLWVGTQAGGLDHYDPVLDRFEHYASDPMRSDSIASEDITALMLDRRDWLWIAGTGGRLQWLDRVTNHFLDVPLGDQSMLADVRVLRQARDGSVLIGSRDGLWQCDINAGNLHELRFDPAHSLDVRALAVGPSGDIWVATTGSGIYRFSETGKAVAHYHSGAGDAYALPGDEIRSLQFDRRWRLWVATKANGLLRIDPDSGRIEQYRHDPSNPRSLSADRQESLLIDRDGLVWAGSWNDGISVHDPRTEAFVSLRSVPGDPGTLPNNPVVAALANPDGTLWLGFPGGGGMGRFDPQHGIVQRFVADENKADALPVALIEQITRGHDGSIWVATAGGGLMRLPPGSSKFVRYRHDPNDPTSLASDDLLYAMEDRKGTLWVGSVDAGLDELCEGCKGFRHHQHESANPDSIGFGPVASVMEDRRGALWVALRPGGLDRYDRGSDRFEHFRPDQRDPKSISNDTVTTFLQDSHGEIWIGTQGGGLNHLLPGSYANPRFETISSAEGLAADAIGSIVEDAGHALWISTTAGISRYDPATRHIVNFGPNAGTLTQGYYINVAAQLADGRILFGGLSGATLFQPDQVELPPIPTPILTDVLLNNQPAELDWEDPRSPLRTAAWTGGTVTFGYRQRNIGFEFSAFGFADPRSVQYSYLLEGHDEQWINTDASRRFATFTDLPAGDYLLRVRARRAGFPWNTREARMSVRVLPAPWVSPLAILGYCAALLLVVGIGGWRTRENWKRQERVREAIRASAERLKYALWGSGGELWDVDLRTGAFVRENRLPDLKVSQMLRDETVASDGALRECRRLAGIPARFGRAPERRNLVPRVHLPHAGRKQRMALDADPRACARTRRRRACAAHGRHNAGHHDAQAGRGIAAQIERRTGIACGRAHGRPAPCESGTVADAGTIDVGAAPTVGIGEDGGARRPRGRRRPRDQHALGRDRDRGIAPARRSVAPGAATDARSGGPDRLPRNDWRKLGNHPAQPAACRPLDQEFQARRGRPDHGRASPHRTRRRSERHFDFARPEPEEDAHAVGIDCPEPVWIDTYPGALYQIVSNLVMNSLHHAFAPEQSGTITVGARLNGNVVELTYRDDGSGMSDEVRARVFEPFFTTRRGQGGSGLGLHVVYNLVTHCSRAASASSARRAPAPCSEIFVPQGAGK